MGRIAAHSQEQVFEAANKLAENNQEVTPNSLRDILGRGSYSTLIKHIDAWQQTRQAVPAQIILEMPESVKTAFSQCWQAASTEAGKEIASIREAADNEIVGIKRRLIEAVEAIEQLENESNADAARFEALEAVLSSERISAQQLTTNAAAREAGLVGTTDQMRQQISAQQAELARVHTETAEWRTQQAAEMKRLVEGFTRRLSEQAEMLQSSQADVGNLKRLLADSVKNLNEAVAREQAKTEELTMAKGEAARMCDQLKDQKTRSMETIGRIEKSKQVLEAELIAARNEVKNISTRLGRSEGEIAALRAQVASQDAVLKSFAVRDSLPGSEQGGKNAVNGF